MLSYSILEAPHQGAGLLTLGTIHILQTNYPYGVKCQLDQDNHLCDILIFENKALSRVKSID